MLTESLNFLPISHLTEYIALFGLRGAWLFAASPTRRSSSIKATTDGVIQFQSTFGIIYTSPLLQIPRKICCVKSIPITGLPMFDSIDCMILYIQRTNKPNKYYNFGRFHFK